MNTRYKWLILVAILLTLAIAIAVSVVAGIVITIYAVALNRGWQSRQRAIKRQRTQALCADMIALLADDVRAGSMPVQAFTAFAHTLADDPNATESDRQAWLTIARSAAVNEDVIAALHRIGPPYQILCQRLAAAWALLDSGVALAGLAEAIETETRVHIRLVEQQRIQAAAGTATAWTLACLPLAGIGLGVMLGVNPLAVLLHTPFGAACAGGGVLLQLLGWVWVRRISAAATEQAPIKPLWVLLKQYLQRSPRARARNRLKRLLHVTGPTNSSSEISSKGIYWFAATSAGLVVAFFVGNFLLGGLLGLAVTGALGWVFSRLEPASRRREKQQILDWLPYVVVLLGALVRAGWPTAHAVSRLGEAITSPLAVRLRNLGAELALGASVSATWNAHLGDLPAASSLVRAVIRANESGAALAGACERLAERLRSEHKVIAQARAARVPVLMVAPLTTCFLPAFVLVGVVPLISGVLSGALGSLS